MVNEAALLAGRLNKEIVEKIDFIRAVERSIAVCCFSSFFFNCFVSTHYVWVGQGFGGFLDLCEKVFFLMQCLGWSYPRRSSFFLKKIVLQNKDDGDWWLHFGYDISNLKPVGFWPKSTFNSLEDHAGDITWGGYTKCYKGYASPPMGNGQWPGKRLGKFSECSTCRF